MRIMAMQLDPSAKFHHDFGTTIGEPGSLQFCGKSHFDGDPTRGAAYD